MSSKKVLFDEETLEQLTYERSKWWSNFLQEASLSERLEVLHLDDIESVYGNDAAEGHWTDFDEAEEAPENAADAEVLDVTTLEEKKSFIESSEVQDILNATVPVLKEHQRKWEEAGLERVLNTFDSARIEQEVGGWMRRYHNTTAQQPPLNRYTTTATDSDDSESMLSSETADYIRSTRKKCNTQRRRSCMGAIGRFRKFHKIHHEHGTVIETTTYRAYNCMCGKYNMNAMGHRSGQWQHGQFFPHERADTQVNNSIFKRSSAMCPQSERKMWRLNRDRSSSTDSDFNRNQNPTLLRSIPRDTRVVETFDSKHSKMLCHKALPAPDHRLQHASMNGSKYETPPRSSLAKYDFTKTAPSKLSKQRQAAKAAIEKLCQSEVPISDETSSSTDDDDDDETFKRNLQIAIGLSLKTLNAKEKKNKTLKAKTRRDSSISSVTSTLSASSADKKLLKATTTPLQKSVSSTSNDEVVTKENTFLSNLGNVCNSTALNNAAAAARQQLPNIRHNMPVVKEDTHLKCMGRISNTSDASMTTNMREANGQKEDHATTLNRSSMARATATAKVHKPDTTHRSVIESTHSKYKSIQSGRKSSSNSKVALNQREESKSNSTEQESSSDTSYKSKSNTVIALSVKKQKTKEANTSLAGKKLRDSSNHSFSSSISASSAGEIATLNAPRTTLPQSDTQNTSRKLKHNKDETKENIFLNNKANICNSTALNNAAAAGRQQLPTIGEHIEKRVEETSKKSIDSIMHISEIASDKVKTIYHATALNNSTVNKEQVISTTPSNHQFKKPICTPKQYVVAKRNKTPSTPTPQPNRKKGRPKKQANDCVNNITPVAKETQKSITPLGVATKPKRILVYKPTPQADYNTTNSSIQVTREILSAAIGVKDTQRFLKYNLQSLTFPKTSTVYFVPPEEEMSSSDSDDDPLEKVGLCGELCASD